MAPVCSVLMLSKVKVKGHELIDRLRTGSRSTSIVETERPISASRPRPEASTLDLMPFHFGGLLEGFRYSYSNPESSCCSAEMAWTRAFGYTVSVVVT